MTVAELMAVLVGLDGTELVCIDTTYWSPCGVYPAAGKLVIQTVARCDDDEYRVVVLQPRDGYRGRCDLPAGHDGRCRARAAIAPEMAASADRSKARQRARRKLERTKHET
jgi:hypothetical protein